MDPRYLEEWRSQHPGAPDPPEKMPDDMIESIMKSRNLNRSLVYLDQL
jgi:metallopeptidase MepB